MKYFVVSLSTGTCVFDFKCSRINEAYNAVQEASAEFGISVNLDEIMKTLVYMNEGRVLSHEQRGIRITVREGEV